MCAKIELLSEAIINQIAAGEVITRPACVVRELVQNSVDAHATVITIEVWQDSDEITKIRIRDNGDGIAPDQLETAFLKHATSKIKVFDDIFSIQTLGFRGEALSAIASISHIKAQTSIDNRGEGTAITLLGASKEKIESASTQKGFDITVSRLFFNTPVRKKFLKSITGEKIAIKEEVVRQTLATEQIEINYILYHNQHETFRLTLPTVYTLKDKIFTLFKRHNLRGSLVPVEDSYMGFDFSGYLTDQKCRLANRKSQFLFIGGRAITNPIFIKTLERVYAHILPSRKYPMAFLKVVIPPHKVDINVHPAKKEVRLENAAEFGKALYTVTHQVVLKKILSGQKDEFTANIHYASSESNLNLKDPQSVQMVHDTQRIAKLQTRQLFREHAHPSSPPEASAHLIPESSTPPPPLSTLPHANMDAGSASLQTLPETREHSETIISGSKFPQVGPNQSTTPPPPVNLKVLAQLEKCYIVFTLNGELYITDQHAAHERINYDMIMQYLNNKKPERMALVVPLFFERNLSDVDRIVTQQKALNELGVSAEPFSQTVISVSEVPCFIPEHKLESVLSDILDMIIEEAPVKKTDFYRDLIARMACRMSVMSGDVLSLLEMENLILSLYEKNSLLTCPHGRPFVKKIASSELAHFFDRSRHIR